MKMQIKDVLVSGKRQYVSKKVPDKIYYTVEIKAESCTEIPLSVTKYDYDFMIFGTLVDIECIYEESIYEGRKTVRWILTEWDEK